MLKKNLSFILSLFIIFALVLGGPLSYATDDVDNNTASNTEVTNENTANTTIEDNANATSSDKQAAENDTTTAADTSATHDGDMYKAGGDIEITDSVNGNVFVTGNTVTVKGQIGGDLFVTANTVNIDGAQIYGNIFACANTITLNGLVYDLYGVCNTLNVPYQGTVYRDIKVYCNNASIDGVVGGNVKITANQKLTLEADCMIYKDLNYSAPNEVEVKDGTVQGNVHYSSSIVKTSAMDYVMDFAVLFVFVLLVWLGMIFFAPKFTEKATAFSKKQILPNLGLGVLGFIFVPVISILFCMTGVGVKVGLALLALYGLMLAIASTVVIVMLAKGLAHKVKFFAKFKNLFAVIVVTLVLWAITLIPYVGFIVKAIVTLYGLGLIMRSIFLKKEKKAKKEEAKA